MTNSDELEEKHERNRDQRYRQIKRWAAFVRSHPDREWGSQVNSLVDAQLSSARHYEGERPTRQELHESPLFDES